MPKTTLDDHRLHMSTRNVRTFNAAGVQTSNTSTDYLVNNEDRSRSTVNTPGFRNKTHGRREDLPMNPFSYTEEVVQHPYGQIVSTSTTGQMIVSGHLFPGGGGVNFEPRGISSSDRTRIANEAQLASLLDLKGQKVNVGVTLAERRETSKLILGAAKRIADSSRAFKRGDFAGGFRLLGDEQWATKQAGRVKRYQKGRPSASAEVLAMQLGWKPLIGDVYNYAELLAENANRPVRMRVSTSRTHRWSGVYGPPDYWEGVDANRREHGSYTVKHVYVFSDSPGLVHDLASMGVTNPLSWAWELTALSFVADWFLRIGDFIDALDATLGLSFEKGCTTTFEKWTVRYSARGSYAYGGTSTTVNGNAFKRRVVCQRAVATGFPGIPPIVLGSGLGFSRGITAGALLRQYFKR